MWSLCHGGVWFDDVWWNDWLYCPYLFPSTLNSVLVSIYIGPNIIKCWFLWIYAVCYCTRHRCHSMCQHMWVAVCVPFHGERFWLRILIENWQITPQFLLPCRLLAYFSWLCIPHVLGCCGEFILWGRILGFTMVYQVSDIPCTCSWILVPRKKRRWCACGGSFHWIGIWLWPPYRVWGHMVK